MVDEDGAWGLMKSCTSNADGFPGNGQKSAKKIGICRHRSSKKIGIEWYGIDSVDHNLRELKSRMFEDQTGGNKDDQKQGSCLQNRI